MVRILAAGPAGLLSYHSFVMDNALVWRSIRAVRFPYHCALLLLHVASIMYRIVRRLPCSGLLRMIFTIRNNFAVVSKQRSLLGGLWIRVHDVVSRSQRWVSGWQCPALNL